jgi:hypothetical protein
MLEWRVERSPLSTHAGLGWESSEAMDMQIVDFNRKISRTLHQRIVLQLVSL